MIVFICIHLWNCFWAFWKIIFHPRGQILILLEFSDFLWLQLYVPLGIWVDLVVVKVTRHHYKETRSSFRTLARNLVVVRTFSTSRCPFSLLILVWGLIARKVAWCVSCNTTLRSLAALCHISFKSTCWDLMWVFRISLLIKTFSCIRWFCL